jgi:hypothetical protein
MKDTASHTPWSGEQKNAESAQAQNTKGRLITQSPLS